MKKTIKTHLEICQGLYVEYEFIKDGRVGTVRFIKISNLEGGYEAELNSFVLTRAQVCKLAKHLSKFLGEV